MESIAKYGIGELKVVGYSEYLNRTVGSEFNSLSKPVKNEARIISNQKSNTIESGLKQYDKTDKVLTVAGQIKKENSEK